MHPRSVRGTTRLISRELQFRYSSFWAVQKWLSDPNLALHGAEERRAMLANVDACCAALENTAPSEDSATRARDTWLAERLGHARKDLQMPITCDFCNSEAKRLSIVTMGSKYLTNSRLLRIQLRDPVPELSSLQ